MDGEMFYNYLNDGWRNVIELLKRWMEKRYLIT